MKNTVAPILGTPEVIVGESTQPVEIEGPSWVLIEVPAEASAEPLKEGTEMVSPNSLSSERHGLRGVRKYLNGRQAKN